MTTMTVTVSKSDYTIIKSVMDLMTFLLFALYCFAKSIAKALIPKSYQKLKSLEGERIVITGGAGGLGKLIALKLAKHKAVVILWDINPQGVEDAVKQVEASGGKVYGYVVDLSNRNDVYRVAEKTAEEVGEVTMLINNAGVATGKEFLETPDELIQKTFDVNVLAHFWTTKAFLPSMVKNNHGHIVTVASMAGHVGIYKLVDYCSSKFAAVGFDEALRVELDQKGSYGVHTTVICPYFIQSTGMFDDVRSRFLPTLKSVDVADRIVEAMQRNEVCVMIPELFRYAFFVKWIVPFRLRSVFVRGLVPDASPSSQASLITQMTPKICATMAPTLTLNNRFQNDAKMLS